MNVIQRIKQWLVPPLEDRDPQLDMARRRLNASFLKMEGTTHEIRSSRGRTLEEEVTKPVLMIVGKSSS